MLLKGSLSNSWSADGATQRVGSIASPRHIGRAAQRPSDCTRRSRGCRRGFRGSPRLDRDRAAPNDSRSRPVQPGAPRRGASVLVAAGGIAVGTPSVAAISHRHSAVHRRQRQHDVDPRRDPPTAADVADDQRRALPCRLPRPEHRRAAARARTRAAHPARRLARRAGHRPRRRRARRGVDRDTSDGAQAAGVVADRHRPGLPDSRPDPAGRPDHRRRHHQVAARPTPGPARVGTGTGTRHRPHLPPNRPDPHLPRGQSPRPRLASGPAAHRGSGLSPRHRPPARESADRPH